MSAAASFAPCPPDIRARLRALQNEAVSRLTKGRHVDAGALEWARLEHVHRMAFLLLAGVDGELSELAGRAWLELPDPERAAVRMQIRAMRKAMQSVFVLAGRL